MDILGTKIKQLTARMKAAANAVRKANFSIDEFEKSLNQLADSTRTDVINLMLREEDKGDTLVGIISSTTKVYCTKCKKHTDGHKITIPKRCGFCKKTTHLINKQIQWHVDPKKFLSMKNKVAMKLGAKKIYYTGFFGNQKPMEDPMRLINKLENEYIWYQKNNCKNI